MAGAAANRCWGWKAPPPRLRAAGFLAFRTLWFALLALAVVAPLAGAWLRNEYVERVVLPAERVGLALDTSAGNLRLAWPYSDEAVRSGIAAGDRILAVDGQPVSDALVSRPALAARLRGPEGSRIRLRTRSAAGAERDHVLTRTQDHIDRDFVAAGISYETYQAMMSAVGALPVFCLIGAAMLLFRRRSRDLVPALFSLSFLLVSATIARSNYFYIAIGLPRAAELLSLAGWNLFILALMLFPDGRFAQRWAPWVALLLIPPTPSPSISTSTPCSRPGPGTACWSPLWRRFCSATGACRSGRSGSRSAGPCWASPPASARSACPIPSLS